MDYEIKIIKAEKIHAFQISQLYERVWAPFIDEWPVGLFKARTPSVEGVESWMREGTYFIAITRDTIVGVVCCELNHGTCVLKYMAVDSSFRRQGIGTLLVQRTLEFAKDNKALKVWLDTLPTLTDAISLYQRFGFKKVGELKKHFWGADVELYELLL